MYPAFLDLRGKLVLVVGAGPVGWRRMENLLAAKAKIRLICLTRPANPLPNEVDCLVEPYQQSHLQGVRMAIAAASETVNQQVVVDARQRGIWVNSASHHNDSDFHVPAVVRRGDLLIALSTGGSAPSLTRVLRQHLEELFDDSYARWIEIVGELRPRVLQLPKHQQKLIFERLCDWHWLERLRQEDWEKVRHAMLAFVEASSF